MSQYSQGWINDPNAVEQSLSRLAAGSHLKMTTALKGSWKGETVAFWHAEQKVLGTVLDSWDQSSVGSCVSHGCGRAAQDLLLIQIANGDLGEFSAATQVCREAIYGGSRVEVGGQRGSYSDGSTGSWAAEWLNKWGVLLYQKYGPVDLSDGYSVSRCKAWGAKGCPDELEPVAKLHPIKSVALCTSVEDAADLIANGYPVPVCSDRGFSMKRGANGFCSPSGTWNHCMEFRGVLTAKGNRKALVDQNSWGDYLGSQNNVVELDDGNTITLPPGCFLVDFEVADKMLRQRDSFAYSHATSFAPQKLSWKLW